MHAEAQAKALNVFKINKKAFENLKNISYNLSMMILNETCYRKKLIPSMIIFALLVFSCKLGMSKIDRDRGSIDNPVEVSYNNLENWLQNEASNGTNYIKLTNVPTSAFGKATNDEYNRCVLGKMLEDSEKKIFLEFEMKGNYKLTILKNAFHEVRCLKGVVFPPQLRSIETGAFDMATKLKVLDFSKCTQLESINNKAFSGVVFLEKINFSNCSSLKTIGDGAFQGQFSLKKLDFSDCKNLEKINASAFSSSSDLEFVDLSKCGKLKKLGSRAFEKSPKARIKLPDVEDLNIGIWAFGVKRSNNYHNGTKDAWCKEIQIPLHPKDTKLKQKIKSASSYNSNPEYPDSKITTYSN